MTWHEVAAYFVGGAFLANFVLHVGVGISGRPFHTPFARPPFRGLSSPAVNVLWGMFNLAVAYTLLFVVGDLEPRRVTHAAVAAGGFALAAIGIVRSAARLRATLAQPASLRSASHAPTSRETTSSSSTS